jgi:hypothetical protein
MSRTKSPERRLIEQILRESTTPLSPPELARLSGLTQGMVRKCLTNIARRGVAHNTTPNSRQAMYLIGPAPVLEQQARNYRAPTPLSETPNYDGSHLRPYEGRPGAMVAFTLPSLVNGKSVPRVAPKLIASQPEPKA